MTDYLMMDDEPVRIWEISNFSDPITLLCNDHAMVAAAVMVLGEGHYGATEVLEDATPGREVPIFLMCNMDTIANWFRSQFPNRMGPDPGATASFEHFMESADRCKMARTLRTVQVCKPEERRAYQKALHAITDPAKKQEYAEWFRKQRQSSLNNITKRAWQIADGLEKVLRRQEEAESAGVEVQ